MTAARSVMPVNIVALHIVIALGIMPLAAVPRVKVRRSWTASLSQ